MMPKCDCPMCETEAVRAAPWRGKINHSNLRAACEHLKIGGPVRIQRGGTEEGECGHWATHHAMQTGEHLIRINSRLGKEQANACVLHELTHASQFERDPNSIDRYKFYERTFGYADNPYEVEADANMHGLRDRFKVVVA